MRTKTTSILEMEHGRSVARVLLALSHRVAAQRPSPYAIDGVRLWTSERGRLCAEATNGYALARVEFERARAGEDGVVKMPKPIFVSNECVRNIGEDCAVMVDADAGPIVLDRFGAFKRPLFDELDGKTFFDTDKVIPANTGSLSGLDAAKFPLSASRFADLLLVASLVGYETPYFRMSYQPKTDGSPAPIRIDSSGYVGEFIGILMPLKATNDEIGSTENAGGAA